MKISGLWLVPLLASVVCGSGQVTVEVTQEQQQFLPGEALNAAVRITNLSGQELHLGEQEDWLTFSLESRDGIVVPKLGEAPVTGGFILESSKVAIKRVDLAPYFLLTKAGNYQIVATVRIPHWNRDITSPAKTFDVVNGTKIWEREVGVPKAPESAEMQPEVRRYTLQQTSYRGRMRLYLRITDGYGKLIRLIAVSPMVSFGRPESQVDKLSSLHVLCQEGPSVFNYVVCDFQGEVVIRQVYDYANSRPRLRLDDDGTISVAGGSRRVTANDVPEPRQDASDDSPKPLHAESKSAQPTNQPNPSSPTR